MTVRACVCPVEGVNVSARVCRGSVHVRACV